jgi:hypothetical protein
LFRITNLKEQWESVVKIYFSLLCHIKNSYAIYWLAKNLNLLFLASSSKCIWHTHHIVFSSAMIVANNTKALSCPGENYFFDPLLVFVSEPCHMFVTPFVSSYQDLSWTRGMSGIMER